MNQTFIATTNTNRIGDLYIHMRKIYYVTGIDLEHWGIGIQKKIRTQMELLKKEFSDVQYISLEYSGGMRLIRKILFKALPFISIMNVNKLDEIEHGSLIYMRYSEMNRKMYKTLKEISKRDVKILLEIPTYPYDFESNCFKRKVKLLIDRRWRVRLKEFVDRIVTYSDDVAIFGIPTIRISNAVSTKDGYTICPKNCSKEINLVGVAALAFWHGYDRLIKGIYTYYQNGGKRNVIFHVVGDGRKTLREYKRMVSKFGLEEHVKFHGWQNGEDLDSIYKMSVVAIDSLGRHRSCIKYNSTLKGKEYMLKGLPVVSGVITELDYDNNFKYYYRVPSDESPIDVEALITWIDEVYSRDSMLVEKEIRTYAIQNYNYSTTFMPVISYIDSIICE